MLFISGFCDCWQQQFTATSFYMYVHCTCLCACVVFIWRRNIFFLFLSAGRLKLWWAQKPNMNTGRSLTTETHRTRMEAMQPTRHPTLTVNRVCLVRCCMFGCFLHMNLSFHFAPLKQPQHIIQLFPRDPPSRANLVSEIDEDRRDGTWKFQCFDSLCCTLAEHWGIRMCAWR